MRFAGIVGVVVGLAGSGCVTAGHGDPVGKTTFGPLSTVASQVSFDHGCPPERIRVIRSDNIITVDLDVCGVVRRYKSVASGHDGPPQYTWLDVTGSYPPGALPSPLPSVPGT
jgi:hypothetical protein